jgi:hypothetical protein
MTVRNAKKAAMVARIAGNGPDAPPMVMPAPDDRMIAVAVEVFGIGMNAPPVSPTVRRARIVPNARLWPRA